MALTASGLYRLRAELLRVGCSERGLQSSGPVRVLRNRLAEYLRVGLMDRKEKQADIQASVPAGTSNAGNETSTPLSEGSFQGTSGASHQVPVDLLRQVEPLASEQPEDILRFFCHVGGNP
jgi:hypothetical protein